LAFSLVELMIVVAVIGILAAMVIPKVTNYSQQAKEAAAKENLHTLRAAIEVYASRHNGVPPGYMNDDPVTNPIPANIFVVNQLASARLLRKIPQNPINNKATLYCLRTEVDFPPVGTDNWGYLYKPSTKTIKLDAAGRDSKGVLYSDY